MKEILEDNIYAGGIKNISEHLEEVVNEMLANAKNY